MKESRALDLRSRAEDDLRAIRLAMEGSARFTSVSGIHLIFGAGPARSHGG